MAFRMGLLGKKIGMTQKFDAKGEWIPLSVIQLGPCVVLDIKTKERDGYTAIQLGFDEMKEARTKKPLAGKFAKAKTAPQRFIREIRLTPEEIGQFSVGQQVRASEVFSLGDVIDVIGTSKGKGYQGVMKRHNFKGFRATHGTHEYFRHGGSIGCRLTPGHVHKGKRMSGQMGNRRVTVQNLQVVDIDTDNDMLILRGAIPGAPQGYLMVKKAVKRSGLPFQLKVAQPPQPEEAAEPQAEGEAQA